MSQKDYIKYQMTKYEGNRSPRDYEGVITETTFNPRVQPLQRYAAPTDRAQLVSSGVGEVQATLAIPYINFLPRTSDADAVGVQVIVAAIQDRLGLPKTGYINKRMERELERVAGPTWFDKPWNALLADATRGGHGKATVLKGVGDDFAQDTNSIKKVAHIAGLGALGVWGYGLASKDKKLQNTAMAVGVAAFFVKYIA